MKKANPYVLVGSTMVVCMTVVGLTFSMLGIDEASLRIALRETARISLLLFLLVFIASPLQRISKSSLSKYLMINRRYLGICFATSHFIHLALILSLIYLYSGGDLLSVAPLNSFIVGGIGYAFIIAMTLTSNNQSLKRLGPKRWKTLHRVGMYYLLVSFLASYAGLLEKDFLFYLPFVIALAFAMVIRLVAFMTTSKRLRTA